jgi:hypothetical protein
MTLILEMSELALDENTAKAVVAILVIFAAFLSVGIILQMSQRFGDVNDDEDEEDVSRRICCVCLCPPNDAPGLSSIIH